MSSDAKRQRSTGPSNDRAVSDIIGFTLMFSIIILGVGLVSVAGVTQLVSLSESEELRSAERGMESAAATLEDMNRRADKNRTFSMALTGGDVWMNQSTFNITTDGEPWEFSANSLSHRFDRSPEDVTVRYEAGGVFRSDGAFPRYEPSFKCSENGGETILVVSAVNLTLEDSQEGVQVSGGYNRDLTLDEFSVPSEAPVANFDRALDFRANLVKTERDLTQRGATIVVNATQTANPETWDRHFENIADAGDSEWDSVDEAVYECDADRALVRVSTIQLELVNLPFG